MRIINLFLFIIIIFQASCSAILYDTQKDDPIFELGQKYAVRLDTTWTTKQAQALLKIFESISPSSNKHHSVWSVSDEDLQDDIKIESQNGLKSVTIRSDVFPVDGSEKKSSRNKRLYHAAVQFITENGTNRDAIKLILKERYGISVDVPSYELLTRRTTKETAKHYSEFRNEDLMIFIAILEEFPKALQKTPELKYVICRIDDKIRAPGLAWTSEGYIELSQALFERHYAADTRSIIAHEKTHFLWDHLFTDQLKQDWAKLGGWYENPESESGWSTKSDRREFVTDYAYEKNPNEDMAESLAYYLVFPNKLRSCSAAKYDFVHNRIILTYGMRYIPPDLLRNKSFSGKFDHLLKN